MRDLSAPNPVRLREMINHRFHLTGMYTGFRSTTGPPAESSLSAHLRPALTAARGHSRTLSRTPSDPYVRKPPLCATHGDACNLAIVRSGNPSPLPSALLLLVRAAHSGASPRVRGV
jgi:hypothetical protein